jgi:3-isopropylmalate/(R)-2-methylmalate dehydratase large subunit
MAGVLATGETWIKVPATILINCSGRLPAGVSAKDMMLALCANLGVDGGEYQALQFAGETIAELTMHERMTLTNMAAELGAQAGLIAADETTAAYIRDAGGDPGDIANWQGDAGASYRIVHDIDVTGLEPQVALPHNPATAKPVSEAAGTRVQQAYIGACTGAKLDDLRMAADVLRGRRVAAGTRLLVAPASTRTTAIASGDGTLQALTEAGAILMPSGCGACAGYGAGVLAEGEVCISSTARNFKGRMGANTSIVYLGSPYTVAASAVAGVICDPRDMLDEGRGAGD